MDPVCGLVASIPAQSFTPYVDYCCSYKHDGQTLPPSLGMSTTLAAYGTSTDWYIGHNSIYCSELVGKDVSMLAKAQSLYFLAQNLAIYMSGQARP